MESEKKRKKKKKEKKRKEKKEKNWKKKEKRKEKKKKRKKKKKEKKRKKRKKKEKKNKKRKGKEKEKNWCRKKVGFRVENFTVLLFREFSVEHFLRGRRLEAVETIWRATDLFRGCFDGFIAG